MPRRRKSRLFAKGHRYTVSHGQVVIPAKTHRGALKLAVKEARTWNSVVHVLERSGRDWTTVATCMPRWKHVDDLQKRPKAITCHLKRKPAKETR